MPQLDDLFRGVGVALLTAFDDAGAVDADRSAALADRLVDKGIEAVVVAGTTGEAASLTIEERSALLRAVRLRLGDHVPLIAGVGAPTIATARVLARAACDDGAGGLLALSPPGSHDLVSYYEAIAEAAGDVPVIAYHFPAVSLPGIPLDSLIGLPVTALKDSSADAERLCEELALLPDAVYTGSAALLAFAGPAGARGAIVALANVEPDLCLAAFAGDLDAQRRIASMHPRLHRDFPAALKEAAAVRFGFPKNLRRERMTTTTTKEH